MIRLLVIDDIVPQSTLGYGYPRALTLYNSLADLGFDLTLIPINARTDAESVHNAEINAAIRIIRLGNKKEVFHILNEEIDNFDAIFISRPKNFRFLLDYLRGLERRPLIIYDVEALNALREVSRLKTEQEEIDDDVIDAMIDEELSLIDQADMITCVSHSEMKLIQHKLNKRAFFLTHHHEVPLTSNSFGERKDLLFVGGFYAIPCPNVDALSFFLKDVFPLITNCIDVKLNIIGYNAEQVRAHLPMVDPARIHIAGHVESLYNSYNDARVTVIPTRIGAGISYKFTETLSFGTPSITSSLIAGQVISNDLYGGYDDPAAFAERVVELYTNEQAWMASREQALRIIADNYTKEAITGEIIKLRNHIAKLMMGKNENNVLYN